MSVCPLVLLDCLTSDLGSQLPSLTLSELRRENAKGLAWPGMTAREFAMLALRDSLLKKFEDEKAPDADAKALAKFLDYNDKCRSQSSIDLTHITEIEMIAVGEAKSFIYDFWFKPGGDYILSVEEVSRHMGVGPGASVGASGNSFYEKLGASPLTGTSKSLYSLYKRETERYSLWAETEKIRSAKFGEFVLVPGNKLTFVPKQRDISRTICTEPLLNMLVQKGIAHQIRLTLDKRFGINLSSQPARNAALARYGSEYGTLGTIDLSNASDSISIGILREVLPPYILSWMMEARSPCVTLPNGSVTPLHMIASMGNDFTFPLQTVLFSSIVLGVYKALGITAHRPDTAESNWGAFGDDIIVEARAYDLVVCLLERFGFTVNKDKSFNKGPFRESCGSDFLSGYNVRGIYCRSLKTKQDVYSLINRLNVWSANHEVPLPITVGYLMSALKKADILPVPAWEADTAGVKVPLGLLPFVPMRFSEGSSAIVYKRWMAKPTKVDLLAVEARPPRRKGWFINHPGILMSAVSGYLRGGSVVLRTDRPYYRKQLAIAPCWDYVELCHSRFTSDGWRRWVTSYVKLNSVVV